MQGTSTNNLEFLGGEIAANSVRRERSGGRDWLVAPVSMIVPGVLPGSRGALYYPDDEVASSAPAWDGVPITVGHPRGGSGYVTAKDKSVLDRQGIGEVRASTFNGKLRAEAWIDVARAARVDRRVVDNLEANGQMEVSTGLFTDNEPAQNGAHHNGRAYAATARRYRPDHLAILPDERGACSVQDGCGLNVNIRCEYDVDVNNAFCPTGEGGGQSNDCNDEGDRKGGGTDSAGAAYDAARKKRKAGPISKEAVAKTAKTIGPLSVLLPKVTDPAVAGAAETVKQGVKQFVDRLRGRGKVQESVPAAAQEEKKSQPVPPAPDPLGAVKLKGPAMESVVEEAERLEREADDRRRRDLEASRKRSRVVVPTPSVGNAFCPTGKEGGQDNSCPPGGGGGKAEKGKKETKDEKAKRLLLETIARRTAKPAKSKDQQTRDAWDRERARLEAEGGRAMNALFFGVRDGDFCPVGNDAKGSEKGDEESGFISDAQRRAFFGKIADKAEGGQVKGDKGYSPSKGKSGKKLTETEIKARSGQPLTPAEIKVRGGMAVDRPASHGGVPAGKFPLNPANVPASGLPFAGSASRGGVAVERSAGAGGAKAETDRERRWPEESRAGIRESIDETDRQRRFNDVLQKESASPQGAARPQGRSFKDRAIDKLVKWGLLTEETKNRRGRKRRRINNVFCPTE